MDPKACQVGQMLIATDFFSVFGGAERSKDNGSHPFSLQGIRLLLRGMEDAGLRDVSWRIAGPVTGIAMGFKSA